MCNQRGPTSKDVKIASEGALENHTALKLHIRQKITSKDCHILKKSWLLPMDFRERSIVSLRPMTRICQRRAEHLQTYFFVKLRTAGPAMVANARF